MFWWCEWIPIDAWAVVGWNGTGNFLSDLVYVRSNCNRLPYDTCVFQKLVWVRWDQMFKSKSDRGLGITYLKALNLALLGTWRWHMLVKKESMWSKALVGIYGELQWTDRKWSWWWEKVWGVEKEQRRGCVNWFKESLEKVVRKGRNTRFWLDPWVNGGVIKEWFARCVV